MSSAEILAVAREIISSNCSYSKELILARTRPLSAPACDTPTARKQFKTVESEVAIYASFFMKNK